jgi:hypothetical protein
LLQKLISAFVAWRKAKRVSANPVLYEIVGIVMLTCYKIKNTVCKIYRHSEAKILIWSLENRHNFLYIQYLVKKKSPAKLSDFEFSTTFI